MNDVIDVADTLLKIAKERGQELTPQQLVKLSWFAHGWSLGIRGRGMFHNPIEAWPYGPIIPDLYRATKQWGRNPIASSSIGEVKQIRVAPQDRRFLEHVFERYGHLDGQALSSMACPAGGPWDRACSSGLQGKRIPDKWIEQYFLYAAKRMCANANANADDRTGLNAKTGAKPDEQLACGAKRAGHAASAAANMDIETDPPAETVTAVATATAANTSQNRPAARRTMRPR